MPNNLVARVRITRSRPTDVPTVRIPNRDMRDLVAEPAHEQQLASGSVELRVADLDDAEPAPGSIGAALDAYLADPVADVAVPRCRTLELAAPRGRRC